jgi:hypothetical protein
MGRYVAREGDARKSLKILVQQTERKRLPGRRMLTWEDNIKMNNIDSDCVVCTGFV